MSSPTVPISPSDKVSDVLARDESLVEDFRASRARISASSATVRCAS